MMNKKTDTEIYVNLRDLVDFTMALPEDCKYKYDMLDKLYEARYKAEIRVYNSDFNKFGGYEFSADT